MMGGCPYKGTMNEKPECEKWIYNLEETIISTYNQKNGAECSQQGCCCE